MACINPATLTFDRSRCSCCIQHGGFYWVSQQVALPFRPTWRFSFQKKSRLVRCHGGTVFFDPWPCFCWPLTYILWCPSYNSWYGRIPHQLHVSTASLWGLGIAFVSLKPQLDWHHNDYGRKEDLKATDCQWMHEESQKNKHISTTVKQPSTPWLVGWENSYSGDEIFLPSLYRDLVGGWTNPVDTYARQMGSFPQVGVKIKNIFETTAEGFYQAIIRIPIN